ncbi:MAG: methylenetetrahydrofolate reductase (NADPH) [Mariniblastus sp.]|jgi:methylenetetrahydrofolate reductase (NADPH)
MSLPNLFDQKRVISFELYPPKTPAGEESLYEHVERLMQFSPDFVTCTYGAGGSTQGKTLEIVSRVKSQFKVPVASHLTLVNSSVDDLRVYLTKAQEQSIDYIVALRGDPPKGETEFVPTQGGFRYANELVDLINNEFSDLGVLVAGYPEKHREAVSMDVDLENLKRKVDAGAHAVVTQLFYNNDDFFRFRDQCEKQGITVPIVPGLLPVTSLQQIQRITSLCGAALPGKFVEDLEKDPDPKAQFKVGIQQAIEQTQGLIDAGVAGLHFYVLNRSVATSKILESVNLS